jgi:hypothetical protein
MLITDLLEDVHKFGEEEIEFGVFDKDGNMKILSLYIFDNGKYLFKMKDRNGNDTNIIILGLEEADAKTK